MKKIIVSSILAATACLSMVSQANAAPNYSQHHASQVQHQKHGNKADSKHKVVKNKAKVSQQKAKIVAAKHKAQEKHQDKYKNDKQSKNDYRHRS